MMRIAWSRQTAKIAARPARDARSGNVRLPKKKKWVLSAQCRRREHNDCFVLNCNCKVCRLAGKH